MAYYVVFQTKRPPIQWYLQKFLISLRINLTFGIKKLERGQLWNFIERLVCFASMKWIIKLLRRRDSKNCSNPSVPFPFTPLFVRILFHQITTAHFIWGCTVAIFRVCCWVCLIIWHSWIFVTTNQFNHLIHP